MVNKLNRCSWRWISHINSSIWFSSRIIYFGRAPTLTRRTKTYKRKGFWIISLTKCSPKNCARRLSNWLKYFPSMVPRGSRSIDKNQVWKIQMKRITNRSIIRTSRLKNCYFLKPYACSSQLWRWTRSNGLRNCTYPTLIRMTLRRLRRFSCFSGRSKTNQQLRILLSSANLFWQLARSLKSWVNFSYDWLSVIIFNFMILTKFIKFILYFLNLFNFFCST